MTPIIVSENGRNARRIDESRFDLEGHLQEYIFSNPDVIPLYELDTDARLFVAAREFPTRSGPIDALAFDAVGNIYVVETKLYRNPDKRIVVAQALDYGASLWRHTAAFDEFLATLDRHCQQQFGVPFRDKYREFFDLDDEADSVAAIESNLAEGRIKFVVLMDKLHPALLDLIVFVNQNSKFDLYGVELEYYRHDSFEIIIPRLHGGEVKKDLQPTSRRPKPVWTPTNRDEFMRFVEAFHESGQLEDAGKSAIEELERIYSLVATKTAGQIAYWRVVGGARDTAKLTLADSEKHYSIAMDADGRWEAFRGTKSGVQMDVLDGLLSDVQSRRILGRAPDDPVRKQWTVHLDAVTPAPAIEEFVQINRSVVDALAASIDQQAVDLRN